MKQSIYLLLHKSMIMTDYHNRTASLNFFQNHLFERILRIRIQTIRWFIKQQKIRA